MKNLLIIGTKVKTSKLSSLFIPQRFTCFNINLQAEALTLLEKVQIDLILIVVSSPDLNGWHICEEIRKVSTVPIVMILDKEEKSYIVKALKMGADAYIMEPIDEDELLAQVEVVLRRSRNLINTVIQFNGLIWNEDSYELTYLDRPISLTPKEFTILGIFLNHPDKVITQKELITAIWGNKPSISTRTVHSYIRNIRDKLREAGFPIDLHLLTVWGVGYRWDRLHTNS